MKQVAKQQSLWGLWAAASLVVVAFWASGSGTQLWAGSLPLALGMGRLAGLFATFCALTQFVLMGREGWLEPVFGMDRIARFHRLNGYATYGLAVVHPILLAFGYGQLTGYSPVDQLVEFVAHFPYVAWAASALLLLSLTVGFSIYLVRQHVRFEVWYFVHLFNYAAIALIPFHQLANGGDLLANSWFRWYWLALYAFAAINFLGWRWGRMFYRSWKFAFRVERVVPEAPRATSVYIAGRHMEQFRAIGGQFVLVRFLTKGRWWQEHPFSLSRLPNNLGIRLTIRQLGDFTNTIPDLQPGTKVMISGPHGAFSNRQAVRGKKVYIAGGVGITPIRAMLEELSHSPAPSDTIMLYANRNYEEIIFKNELASLAKQLHMPLYHVLSDDPEYPSEHGFVDQEKLARLVPDIAERDVFLCGPPPMMAGVITALKNIGVSPQQIHYERFALHVK